MQRGMRGLVAPVLAAIVLSLAGTPVVAADGGLVVITDATYRVLPDESRVHVTLSSVATSFEPDTEEGRYFYTGLTFVVPPGATNLSAVSRGVGLTVTRMEETAEYLAVEVQFSRDVFYGQSYPYTFSFDLVDTGGAGNRDLRIGHSLVAFPVWAFGSDGEPGGSVRVELPAGYQPNVQGSEMRVADGPAGVVLTAAPSDPLAFFAYVSADRAGAFSETPLEVAMAGGSAQITIRAWDDDPEWSGRTADLLTDGLPAMEAAIGVPYPAGGPLSVEEAAFSRLGEYAGIYDPAESVIRMRYDADAVVGLHEAAHIWFNDRLFSDRWIGEAFAEYYAVTVGEDLGLSGQAFELTDGLLDARIPLNDWGDVGREDLAVEDFAYAATYELAQQIADRADPETLRLVWQSAAERSQSYLVPGDPERDEGRAQLGQAGWQRLLDLLEERSGVGYADLWAEWVVNADQQPLLAARASSRARYQSVLDEADGWRLPAVIRLDLGAWRFDEAQGGLELAERILDDRERIAARVAELELQPSDRLQDAFEGTDGLSAATVAAEVELTTLDELTGAEARLDEQPTLLESIGLLGENPALLLDEARDAYEAGDLGTSRRAAAGAIAERNLADDQGASRATLAAAALLALDGLALSAIGARRLRRRPASLSTQ